MKTASMNKSYRTDFCRVFLVDELPEPLTRASAHLQIFDNYIPNTRLRIRRVRSPENKEWTVTLQQRFPVTADEPGIWKAADIFLNEAEYAQLKIFEGEEIRKNRYFHEFDGRTVEFDLYLGELWGLCMARIEFASAEEMNSFEPKSFMKFEVTGNEFFFGGSLVDKTMRDVEAAVAALGDATEPDVISRLED
ncbi:MAG: hypothetical protein QUS14_16890 [Pyrinomonadaceae bacterium]|nr:hypothetical protein [Pyrinomonadaceae bacterium]